MFDLDSRGLKTPRTANDQGRCMVLVRWITGRKTSSNDYASNTQTPIPTSTRLRPTGPSRTCRPTRSVSRKDRDRAPRAMRVLEGSLHSGIITTEVYGMRAICPGPKIGRKMEVRRAPSRCPKQPGWRHIPSLHRTLSELCSLMARGYPEFGVYTTEEIWTL
ncbi:hypothetical protein FA13DRAFT_804444 [Coprinellus micaceus]|uniref:Uncharacterized protein n=1 Tax=Coprinellus micaceus TaxID=71717 RepID=A0A4Y7T2G8_COPMI|nr:hypothetical protein FA13DRAFT_804444 [Coprinellus micaceus]